MKLPSLFTKTPRYKRFSYSPRYYDPVAEELREREERIKRELKLTDEEEVPAYRARISGSFHTSKKTAGRQADPSASLVRIIVLLFLTVTVVAYLQFGEGALYLLLLFVPLYFFLRLRRK